MNISGQRLRNGVGEGVKSGLDEGQVVATDYALHSRLRFTFFAGTEIRTIRMMENERAYARFRVHHEAFRELNADFFRPQ